jgi:hypothetical protein
MHYSLQKPTLLLLAGAWLLSGCSTFRYAEPAPQIPGLAKTLAAETMTARQKSQIEVESPAQQAASQDTLPAYEYSATITPVPTATPIPMLTPYVVSNLQVEKVDLLQKCDNAATFIRDVTIPDNEIMKKGERFVKTWQFKNSGSCTWTPDYAIVFVWGDQMNGETPKPIGQTIAPGQTIEISTELQAPNSPGEYQGSWSFLDAEGQQFGTGSKASQPFWVVIIVPGRLDWGKEGGGCKIGG